MIFSLRYRPQSRAAFSQVTPPTARRLCVAHSECPPTPPARSCDQTREPLSVRSPIAVATQPLFREMMVGFGHENGASAQRVLSSRLRRLPPPQQLVGGGSPPPDHRRRSVVTARCRHSMGSAPTSPPTHHHHGSPDSSPLRRPCPGIPSATSGSCVASAVRPDRARRPDPGPAELPRRLLIPRVPRRMHLHSHNVILLDSDGRAAMAQRVASRDGVSVAHSSAGVRGGSEARVWDSPVVCRPARNSCVSLKTGGAATLR